MGIAEDILAELKGIRAALESGATGGETAEKKPAAKRAAKAKGPTLEDVQNLIRELVAADDANKAKIKAATASLGGQRAGDFEGDDEKLASLHALLTEIAAGTDGGSESDDDLL